MTKLILLQHYGLLGPGDPMEVTAGVAQLLIARGIAREAGKKEEKRK